MTGLLLIGRRPSAHKSAMAFFICFLPKLFGEIVSFGFGPSLCKWGWGSRKGSRLTTSGTIVRPPPPPVLGCPARGRTERHHRRSPEGRRPRPRGERPGARAPRTAGALEGSRAGLPSGGGEGNAGPRARRAPAGISHTSQ